MTSGVAKGGGVRGVSLPYGYNEIEFPVQCGVHDRHKTTSQAGYF